MKLIGLKSSFFEYIGYILFSDQPIGHRLSFLERISLDQKIIKKVFKHTSTM